LIRIRNMRLGHRGDMIKDYLRYDYSFLNARAIIRIYCKAA
jgi:hypothetical protein